MTNELEKYRRVALKACCELKYGVEVQHRILEAKTEIQIERIMTTQARTISWPTKKGTR